MAKAKRWILHPQDQGLSLKVSEKLNVSPVVAQLLLNRNIKSLPDAKLFLNPHSNTGPLISFPEETVQLCISLVHDAVEQNRSIMVYGDYDVDGMSSTAMMVRFLRELGARAYYYVPNRFKEGYGLHINVLEPMILHQVGLLITLDCGVSNRKEIAYIKDHSDAKVLVLDHHIIPGQMPNFDGMMNPRTLPLDHDYYALCTAGVVYEFIRLYCLKYECEVNPDHYLDLAALGTVADVAVLTKANRRITQLGLERLKQRKNRGIKSLLEVAKFERIEITSRDLGFVIGPRLNAAGRLSTAKYGIDLLLADKEEEATKIAYTLDKINQDRRQIDSDILAQSIELVGDNPENDKVVVLSSKDWHAGVIGITASKLVERLSRPVVIIAESDNIGRGSARSIGDINIYQLLSRCSHHFETFGGHKEAAGFSIKIDQIPQFKAALIKEGAQSVTDKELLPILNIDGELLPSQLTLSLAEELSRLSPFGNGNPLPLFYTQKLHAIDYRLVGNGQHLKARFSDESGKCIVDGIGFNMADKIPLMINSQLSLAFNLDINHWQGQTNLQLQLIDIK